MPRKVDVVTVGRSDSGIYESVLEKLKADSAFDLRLMVTGAHFSSTFGKTVAEIHKKGFDYEPGLEMLLASDSAQGIGKSIGLGIISFAQAFAASCPDLLIVLGDRVEMICAPIAAMSYNIPVAHIGGGAVTEGAVDELVRHAITKMSHLHFVVCRQYEDRVIQMGEEPWRVINVGSPALDRIRTHRILSREQLSSRLSMDMKKDTLLVTYHPVTLEVKDVHYQVETLLKAFESLEYQVIITYPNADTGQTEIIESIKRFSMSNKDRVRLIKNAGTEVYLSLMSSVAAMVGNSSSGIVEAPSFRLPVVNIGTRQKGKVRPSNVIDVGYSMEEIVSGIRKATSAEFREGLRNLQNPYGDGHAGERILEILRTIPIDDKLIRKKFINLKE